MTSLLITDVDYENKPRILRRKTFLCIHSQIILFSLPRLGNVEINSIVTHVH